MGANFKNTQGANCKSNHGKLCLDSVYGKSRSSELIQGEINKGRVCQKILRIVTTIFIYDFTADNMIHPVVSKPRHI